MTEAETQMRKDAYILVDLLREHFPEFKNAYIVLTAIQGGIRETRRIKGLYTVTGEDMINLVDYPDTIALSAHPMDIHGAKDNSHFLQHLPKAAKIPYRSIVPERSKNLLAVGRCLSADRTAYASVRVQGTLMAIGEAAGIATAILNAGENVDSVDMDMLHNKMLAENAIFND
jgi:hypothetical protein